MDYYSPVFGWFNDANVELVHAELMKVLDKINEMDYPKQAAFRPYK